MSSTEANAQGVNWNGRMIIISMFLLLGYNLSYIGYRLGLLSETYNDVIHDNLGLFTVLEFLAVASIVVDVILRWDVLSYCGKRVRLIVAIVLAAGFGVKLIAHIMTIYTEGAV
jgi:hypothetical protein